MKRSQQCNSTSWKYFNKRRTFRKGTWTPGFQTLTMHHSVPWRSFWHIARKVVPWPENKRNVKNIKALGIVCLGKHLQLFLLVNIVNNIRLLWVSFCRHTALLPPTDFAISILNKAKALFSLCYFKPQCNL